MLVIINVLILRIIMIIIRIYTERFVVQWPLMNFAAVKLYSSKLKLVKYIVLFFRHHFSIYSPRS